MAGILHKGGAVVVITLHDVVIVAGSATGLLSLAVHVFCERSNGQPEKDKSHETETVTEVPILMAQEQDYPY